MDDVIKALLEGASDEKILEMVDELEVQGEMNNTDDQNKNNIGHLNTSYRSCIKVNGRPILPPFMTEEIRLECNEWKRQAIEVEDNLAKKRRARMANNISSFVDKINTKHEHQPKEINTHGEILVSSILNLSDNFDTENEINSKYVEITDESKSKSVNKQEIKNFTKEEEYPEEFKWKDSQNQIISNVSVTSGPKSFEEIKTLVKTMSLNKVSISRTEDSNISKSELNHSPHSDVSSDISDDDEDTYASSIATEVFDKEDTEQVTPFRTVISRLKLSGSREYHYQQYLENNTNNNYSELYDSILSVNTVIENPSFSQNLSSDSDSHEESKEVSPRLQTNLHVSKPTSPVPGNDFRERKGSYSLEKPSPLLLAHIEKFGKDEEDMSLHKRTPSPYLSNEEDMSLHKRIPSPYQDMSHKRTPSPYQSEGLSKFLTSKKSAKRPSTPSEKKEVLKHYLASLSEPPVPMSLIPDKSHIVQSSTSPDKSHIFDSSNYPGKSHIVKSSHYPRNNIASHTEHSPRPPKNALDLRLNLESLRTESPSPSESSMSVPEGSSTYRTTSQFDNQTPSVSEQQIPSSSYTQSPFSNNQSKSINSPADLNGKVSKLALAQKSCLNDLLQKQEAERAKLHKEFEEKQKELVDQILNKFPSLQIPSKPNEEVTRSNLTTEDTKKKGNESDSVSRNLENSFLQVDPNISGASVYSPLLTFNTNNISDIPKKIIRSNTFKKSTNPIIPPAALLPEYKPAWNKLTAIGRGFLTRRLIATDKVQDLKKTIHETLACAVQLHQESNGTPSREDLDLHARLLAQLESACVSLHDIFFRLGIPERMSILALNRAARQSRLEREGQPIMKRRISSATKARLQAKEEAKKKPAEPRWSVKRMKLIRDAKMIQSMPGLNGYSRPVVGPQKSKPIISQRSKSASDSLHNLYAQSIYSINKPVWK